MTWRRASKDLWRGQDTRVRILATLLAPDAGTARALGGHDVMREAGGARRALALDDDCVQLVMAASCMHAAASVDQQVDRRPLAVGDAGGDRRAVARPLWSHVPGKAGWQAFPRGLRS